MVFYEPGKTDHGLPRDPFKVRCICLTTVFCISNEDEGLRCAAANRLDKHEEQ